MTAAFASAVGQATACGTPDDIIMKAIGQDAGADAKGSVVSHATIGLVDCESGRTGVALIALRALLITLANAAMASKGLVGMATGAGFGGGGGGGSIQANGLNSCIDGGSGAAGCRGTGQFHRLAGWGSGWRFVAGGCNTLDQKFRT
jgi:hypothetical protein